MNYHHTEFLFDSERPIELDIYIPSLSLAFEYQGQQHFTYHNETYMLNIDSRQVRERDAVKKEFCKKHGITLLDIPFWWNLSKDSLVATIAKHRPDLVSNVTGCNPISSTLPSRSGLPTAQ